MKLELILSVVESVHCLTIGLIVQKLIWILFPFQNAFIIFENVLFLFKNALFLLENVFISIWKCLIQKQLISIWKCLIRKRSYFFSKIPYSKMLLFPIEYALFEKVLSIRKCLHVSRIVWQTSWFGTVDSPRRDPTREEFVLWRRDNGI